MINAPSGNGHDPASDWSPAAPAGPDEAPLVTVRELLARVDLPDEGAVAEWELPALLNRIEVELLYHGVEVDFLDRLAPRVAYRGILKLLDTLVAPDHDRIQHLDGCDSACESCFQLAYCQVGQEVLGLARWRASLGQDILNPSWLALISKRRDDRN